MLTREVDQVSPDIILLDINMPKMNGLEFLGIVKSYYSLKNIRIFIITTSGEEYERLVAQNLGVTGYVVKPLNFKDKLTGDVLKLRAELLGEENSN